MTQKLRSTRSRRLFVASALLAGLLRRLYASHSPRLPLRLSSSKALVDHVTREQTARAASAGRTGTFFSVDLDAVRARVRGTALGAQGRGAARVARPPRR